MNPRQTTYFGKRGIDQEIMNYIQQHLHKDNYSNLSKQLMYDGIKYRQMKDINTSPKMYENVIHSKKQSNFNRVSLDKKVGDKGDLMARLSKF